MPAVNLRTPQHEAFRRRLGERIRRLREQRDMQQKRLAYLAGVSQARISMLESNSDNTSIGLLLRIADALEVPLVELFPSRDSEPRRAIA